jgi:3-deoxy-D-manno-octulosonic-acid transferase
MQAHFDGRPRVWFHVSSAGEYEQVKPVIGLLPSKYQPVLTFFSPSGYDAFAGRNTGIPACYLGPDYTDQAQTNLDIIQPVLFVLVKYDFWLGHLRLLQDKQVPMVLISAIFGPGHLFFKPWGKIFLETLGGFNHIYVQDHESKHHLATHGLVRVSVAGDTRVDSVLANALAPLEHLPQELTRAIGQHRCLVLGSSYPAEENLAIPHIHKLLSGYLVVIAPHNAGDDRMEELRGKLKGDCILLSDLLQGKPRTTERVIVMDQIGYLKFVYHFADIALVGGGYGKTVHNTLEPAAHGCAMLFGPNFNKYPEAVAFVSRGAALCLPKGVSLAWAIHHLQEGNRLEQASRAARAYLDENRGGAQKVMSHLLEQRIL